MSQKPSPHVGSSFDDFLSEEGLLEVCEEQAIKELWAEQIKRAIQEQGLTRTAGGSHANEPDGLEPSVGPE